MAGCETGFGLKARDPLHIGGAVVGDAAAAAQDDVAFGVAGGDEDGGLAVLGVAEEGVRLARGEDGVDGDAGRRRRCRS